MNSAVAFDVDTPRVFYVEDNPATLVLVEERLALRSDALSFSAYDGAT